MTVMDTVEVHADLAVISVTRVELLLTTGLLLGVVLAEGLASVVVPVVMGHRLVQTFLLKYKLYVL